ncbi:hypothetical protein [Adhaeribacter radiodurans]|uniref:hypothetical protein n=1 Tax=Adhaeribacter radiodurans TaxID=2745197 RepID=UPI001FE58574|nr:hypothetical protein [Adhaeribacter radiodurans]
MKIAIEIASRQKSRREELGIGKLTVDILFSPDAMKEIIDKAVYCYSLFGPGFYILECGNFKTYFDQKLNRLFYSAQLELITINIQNC